MKQHIETIIQAALKQLQQSDELLVIPAFIQVHAIKDLQYGDFSTNVAMLLARPTEKKADEIAKRIIKVLPSSDYIQKVEVADPGFINFFLSSQALNKVIADVVTKKELYGQCKIGRGKRILVAHLSSPEMKRFGSMIANLLDAIGFKASLGCYIHDQNQLAHQFERGFDLLLNIVDANYYSDGLRMKTTLASHHIEPERLQYLLVQQRRGCWCEHYIQYAYVRIASVFKQLAQRKVNYDEAFAMARLNLLTMPEELRLIHTLSCYPDMMMNAALQYKPHLLMLYMRDLAALFHAYYNAHVFIVEDEGLCHARLALLTATRQTLLNGFNLLGMNALETM